MCTLSSNGIDTLLYDFSLQAGDTLKQCNSIIGGSGPYLISSVDSVLIAGSWHRRINISNSQFTALIEGLGSTSGFFGGWDGWIGGNNVLARFSLNGTFLYPDSLCSLYTGIYSIGNISTINFQISPNPISKISTISINMPHSSIGKITLYNLTGSISKILFSGKLNNGTNRIDFDASDFHSGLYVLQFRDEQEASTISKLIEIIH